MRLPTFLQLSYFDYRANKFYKTTIALPDDQIRSYFKEAEKGNHFTEIYNPKGNVKGLIFLLGIANNGNIMLWLRGENYAKLIFKKHLEPVSFSESYQYKETKSIETYKQIFFQNLSDSLRMNIESGFEEKANYIDSTKQFIESRL
jgi:hypothetical protein